MTLDEFTLRRNHPFMAGVHLAANAVSDLRLLIDGPDCTFFRAQNVYGAHDWRSTLLDAGGRHRVLHTSLLPDLVARGHEEAFREVLGRALDEAGAGVVLVSALPAVTITGFDHEPIIEQYSRDGAAPVAFVRGRSLDGDWLDGFRDVLTALARALPLRSDIEAEPDAVAIVGHLMDRNEEDQRGNVREMRRLLAELGLRTVSIWLEGEDCARLADVAKAKVLFALPHGREAARVLGKRLRRSVVDVEIPFGVDATDRFLHAVGHATGRSKDVEELIEREHEVFAERWRWTVPKRFLHREVGFEGDPAFLTGFCETARLVGMRVRKLIAWSSLRRELLPPAGLAEVEIQWEPRVGLPSPEEPSDGALDLLLAHEHARGGAQVTLPFGYPSPSYHASFDAPFLGYRGALCLLDRVANAVPPMT